MKFKTFSLIIFFAIILTNCDNDDTSVVETTVADKVHEGDITISSQDQLDDFGNSKTEIIGILRLVGSDINNIESLQNLTSVNGLEIINTSISDLTYFQELDVALNLVIENNTLLEKINLSSIDELEEDLVISANNSLTEITLSSLTSVNSSLNIFNENISEISNIDIDLSSLEQTESFYIDITATDFNLDLSSYKGNSSGEGSNFEIYINGNEDSDISSISLPNFTGDNVSYFRIYSLSSNISIPMLSKLNSLSITGLEVDLPILNTANGYISITAYKASLPLLEYVDGYMNMLIESEVDLSSLKEVVGSSLDFTRSNIEVLNLSSLVTVHNDLYIINMPNLNTIDFSNLETAELDIWGCPNLYNYCGILNFWQNTSEPVFITSNGFTPSSPSEVTGCE